MAERVHYGPANGPDGFGQAAACGVAADGWHYFSLDPKEVTCKRCLATHEVRKLGRPSPEDRDGR